MDQFRIFGDLMEESIRLQDIPRMEVFLIATVFPINIPGFIWHEAQTGDFYSKVWATSGWSLWNWVDNENSVNGVPRVRQGLLRVAYINGNLVGLRADAGIRQNENQLNGIREHVKACDVEWGAFKNGALLSDTPAKSPELFNQLRVDPRAKGGLSEKMARQFLNYKRLLLDSSHEVLEDFLQIRELLRDKFGIECPTPKL